MSTGPLRVPVSPLAAGRSELTTAAARYVLRVHRLELGDVFVAFDPEARIEADARITACTRDSATVEVQALRTASLLPTRQVTIVQGLAKSDKLDEIVRDATELGATRISPAVAMRSVAAQKSDSAVARWRRIAVEAARQCGRGDVPDVDAPRPLAEILGDVGGEVRLVLVPTAPERLGAALAKTSATSAIVLVIGPEGGLDPAEIAAAEGLGFVAVSLGRFVLRTETACAAALGAVLGSFDEA
jgi:16S rRNA (uracil1498-N3)-methyltransferase